MSWETNHEKAERLARLAKFASSGDASYRRFMKPPASNSTQSKRSRQQPAPAEPPPPEKRSEDMLLAAAALQKMGLKAAEAEKYSQKAWSAGKRSVEDILRFALDFHHTMRRS